MNIDEKNGGWSFPTPVFTTEDDPAKQQTRLINAYSAVMEEKRGVVISEETLTCYRNIMKGSSGKLVSAIRTYYDNRLKEQKAGMVVNNNVIQVLFGNDGKRKSVGWRMTPEKAATFEYLIPLLNGAIYMYSQENRVKNEREYVPQFHYFVNNVKIGDLDMPVKIQVRDLNLSTGPESRYYTHTIIGGRMGASPGLRNKIITDVSNARNALFQ